MAYSEYELLLASGSPRLYAAAVLLGAACGSFLIAKDSRVWPLDTATRRKLLGSVLVGGFIGCALPAYLAGNFVGWQSEHYFIGPKTVIGGLIGGYWAAALYKRFAGVIYDTSDAFARGSALTLAIGRLGCFAGHCCFGVAVAPAWGMDGGDGVHRFPVQLLESALLFGLFFWINALHRKNALEHRRLFAFFLGYGIQRFCLEFIREPIAGSLWGLGFYQWLALFLAGIGAFEIRRRTA
jgi:phosphatidylglycerol:prolipoprotein diacylglycerol transferase